MIITTHQMSSTQLTDLQHLMNDCKNNDGSIPNLYLYILGQERAFPASILYYEDNKLVGFLSAYFFYEDAVEIGLLVHPSLRRKGIAHKLIQAIVPLIQLQNYTRLIFSNPSYKNNSWLLNGGFVFLHSEYYMERDALAPILKSNHDLDFSIATLTDIKILCELDEACFPKKEDNLLHRFQHLLSNHEYQIILAFVNQQPIGKAHMRWEEHGASLSDIAVIPARQGRGLGSNLIAHCINLALSEGKPRLNLDVETHNKKALDLYIRLGFAIQNACDYWSIELSQVLK
ncbi:MAG: GNAT family N-acetyltransferase [bacterium]|nr:GNAT family N-acetyltransferase [bacterium]